MSSPATGPAEVVYFEEKVYPFCRQRRANFNLGEKMHTSLFSHVYFYVFFELNISKQTFFHELLHFMLENLP